MPLLLEDEAWSGTTVSGVGVGLGAAMVASPVAPVVAGTVGVGVLAEPELRPASSKIFNVTPSRTKKKRSKLL